MNYEIVKLDEKIVAGYTARTGNTDPDCQKIIGGLWNDFMGKGLFTSLEKRVNEYCIGLYSDYDFKAMTYDVTVGAQVSSCDSKELSVKRIPAGKYAKFSIKGDVVKAVAAAWEEIWKMPLERTFTGDFEEYISNIDGIAEIDIYVAVK